MCEETRGLLRGRTVLVTGATGFIGGHLVERLVLGYGADVRALVRRYSTAARIARFGIAMPSGSLQDADAVDRAIAGADFVFNLAYVTNNAVEDNLEAIGNVVDSCLRHEVRRLVQISSYMVHEPFSDGEITADTPTSPDGEGYARSKIAVEEHVLGAVRERGLPAVILRPTIVYGPFGGFWTDRPARNLIKGRVVLPDDGSGLCNGVFVDDLVDSMVLAATRPGAVGERFLISGPDTVTWKTFYETLEEGIGVKTLQFRERSPQGPVALGAAGSAKGGARGTSLRRKLRKGVMGFAHDLGEPAKRPLRRIRDLYRRLRPARLPISDDFDYVSRPVCRIDKAREILGYEPKYDFETGMAVTLEYLRWAYPGDTRSP